MKKSNFLTFIFALIPGAGQMYLGMVKKGISLMTLFMGVIALVGFFRLSFLALALPVIWFYTFFDTFNTHNLTPEQMEQQDKFLFGSEDLFHDSWKSVFEKRHRLLGGIVLVLGIYMLYENFRTRFSGLLWQILGHNDFIYNLVDSFPVLIISLLIIAVGINLLRGKKLAGVKMLGQKNDFKEFGGEKDD